MWCQWMLCSCGSSNNFVDLIHFEAMGSLISIYIWDAWRGHRAKSEFYFQRRTKMERSSTRIPTWRTFCWKNQLWLPNSKVARKLQSISWSNLQLPTVSLRKSLMRYYIAAEFLSFRKQWSPCLLIIRRSYILVTGAKVGEVTDCEKTRLWPVNGGHYWSGTTQSELPAKMLQW